MATEMIRSIVIIGTCRNPATKYTCALFDDTINLC